VQYGWDIAERFTQVAMTAHGITIDAEGFGYARGRKRKVDCNAVYTLLEEGLWWSLLAGKRLAIVSGQAEAMAARLMDAEFVRAAAGGEITWNIAAKVPCSAVREPKYSYWSRMRDKMFNAEWDLLLCSAGSLSAILCEHARQAGRKALDIGALDTQLLAEGDRS